MAFKKGQSGNPRGRLNSSWDVQREAQLFAPEALSTLVKCLHHPQQRLPAAMAILDRAYGKPAQHVSTTSESSITHLHILAARAIAAELPTIDAKPEPVDTKRLHLFDPPEE